MSEYPIYTPDNGIVSLSSDLRCFFGRNNISSNRWGVIKTNLNNSTTYISTKNIPANTETNIYTISTYDNQYYCNYYYTILTTLSFVTSDYNNITDEDTIEFKITEVYGDNNTKTYSVLKSKLKRQYMNTFNIFTTQYANTYYLKSLELSVTSTFPLKLRAPYRNTNNYESTYVYYINM